jgi:hypothetical protein
LGQRVELVGQGEHQVEVGHGQQLGTPGGEPAFLGQGLALGTGAVAAVVIAILALTTGIALGDVATQLGGAAARNGP